MNLFDRLDSVSRRGAELLLGWAMPVLYGTALGASAWWLTHPSAASALGTNRLEPQLRNSALSWVAGGIALLLAGYLCAHALAFRKRAAKTAPPAAPSATELTARLNTWLVPCLSAPPLVALLQEGIEEKRALLTVGLAVVTAALWATPFYRAGKRHGALVPSPTDPSVLVLEPGLSSEGSDPPSDQTGVVRKSSSGAQRWIVWSALALLWLGYGLFFSRLAIINHRGLYTATFDLGLYDNIFFQSVRGTPLGCSFLANNYHGAAHFDPILVLLSPLYLLYPHAESLLVLQSFWMGAGLFPLYLIARRVLGCRWQALVVASLWVLYPSLQGANMYDFHSLSLAAPVIVWLLWFLRSESHWGYWLSFVAALLVREDVPLLLCFIAFAAICGGTRFGVRQGWLSIGVALAYFVLVKALLMGAPEKVLTGTQTYSFAYYYSELIPNSGGLREMFASLLSNPSFALQLVSSEDKVLFLLLLFVPLGFLPFLARSVRFALAYGLFFCLLATREPVFSIYFQYAVPLFSVAFALLPEGLLRVMQAGLRFGLDTRKLRRAVLAGLLAVSALLCVKFGGILPNDAFRGGFNPPRRTLDDRARTRFQWVRATAESIPKDAAVGATRRLGPHISNRAKAYDYPGTRRYDYLFVDEGQIEAKGKAAHQQFIKDQHFVVQDRLDNLVLYRRAAPEAPPPAP